MPITHLTLGIGGGSGSSFWRMFYVVFSGTLIGVYPSLGFSIWPSFSSVLTYGYMYVYPFPVIYYFLTLLQYINTSQYETLGSPGPRCLNRSGSFAEARRLFCLSRLQNCRLGTSRSIMQGPYLMSDHLTKLLTDKAGLFSRSYLTDLLYGRMRPQQSIIMARS